MTGFGKLMKSRKSIILLLVFFILLSWVVYLSRQAPAKESSDPQAKLFPGHLAEEVDKVILYNPKEYLTFVKNEDSWILKTPAALEADPARIEEFLQATFNLYYIRKLTDGLGDKSSFDLSEKKVFALFFYSLGGGDTIFIGNTTPAGSFYVQKNSDSCIYTVSKDYGSFFQKNSEDWRMHRISSIPLQKILSFEISGKKQEIKAEIDTATFDWQIQKPRAWKGNRETISEYLSSLMQVQALQIFESLKPNMGLAKPSATFTIKDFAGKPSQWALGTKTEKGIFVKRNDKPEVFLMPAVFSEKIGEDWRTFADHSILSEPMLPSQVKKIVLKTDTSSAVIVKSISTWIFQRPYAGQPADSAALQKMLQKVSSLKADSIFDGLPDKKVCTMENPNFSIQMVGQNFTPVQLDFFLLDKEWVLLKNGHAYFKINRNQLHEVVEEIVYYRL